MSYCLNVACQSPQNPDDGNFCQSCGSKLLLKGRYRAIKAIRQGGFGKTFLGRNLDKPSQPACVIKLFLPLSQTTDSIPRAVAWVETKGKCGYMDKLGNFVITPHFEQAWDFLDGFAQVKVKNKYGYIDKKGRIVSKWFDSIESFFEGLAIAKLSGKDTYINKKGEIVGQLFDEVNPFSEGLARVKLQGKYGYINPTGKIVIPLQFYIHI